LCLSDDGRLSSVQRDGSNSRFLSPQNGTRVISAHYLSDGRIFFFAEIQGEGFVASRVAADGTGLTRLFTLPEDITFSQGTVVPAPDGQRVAYVLMSSHFLGGNLYAANLDGTNARIVSSDIGVAESTAPIWSPDGSRIAFLTGDSFFFRPSELWLVSPDGANLVRAPVPGEPELPGAGVPDWSPDGARLAFDVTVGLFEPEILSSIFIIRADGSDLQRLTAPGDGREPAWGP
jgi:Tol biopolymer transport system component